MLAIHDPTRKAIASISPKVLTEKSPMRKSSGYMMLAEASKPPKAARSEAQPGGGTRLARGAAEGGAQRGPAGLLDRDGDVEGGALARPALDPGATVVGVGDLPDDGEAHAGPASIAAARSQALEHLEDPLVVLGGDAAPEVPYRDLVGVRALHDLHHDAAVRALAHVVDGVPDQVRENLVQA
jgi:hypothetical protein